MNNIRKSTVTISILLFIYLGIIAMFIFHIWNIPHRYLLMEEQNITTIQQELKTILETKKDQKSMETSLEELVFSHAMEVIVYKGERVVFTTFPGVEMTNFRDLFHQDATSYKSQGTYETKQGEYYVLYSIYRLPATTYINDNFSQLTLLLIIVVTLIIIILFLLYSKLIKPLKIVRKSLVAMNEYKFTPVIETQSDDMITKDLNRFAQSIDTKIKVTSQKYSELEVALQFERERLTIMLAMVRAYVHNLKTPTHQMLLSNEMKAEQNIELLEFAQENVESLDKLLENINDILILMDTDVTGIERQLEYFDFISELQETVKLFEVYLQKNDLDFFLECPESLEVHMNKVTIKIILHNLLSNAAKYAQKGSEIEFIISQEENMLALEISNEATGADIERIRQSENMFNVIEHEPSEDAVHRYSTGNGLYLLKEFVAYLDGAYSMDVTGNTVHITVHLQLT